MKDVGFQYRAYNFLFIIFPVYSKIEFDQRLNEILVVNYYKS